MSNRTDVGEIVNLLKNALVDLASGEDKADPFVGVTQKGKRVEVAITNEETMSGYEVAWEGRDDGKVELVAKSGDESYFDAALGTELESIDIGDVVGVFVAESATRDLILALKAMT